MKINFGYEVIGISIRNISVGETFFAQRKSVKEKGLYMKIDGASGLVRNKCGCSYAVNLASGQLREFDCDTVVKRVLTEVVFPKSENGVDE